MLRNLLSSLVIALAIVRPSVGQHAAYNNPIWDDYYRNAKSWEIRSIMDVTADPCQNYYQFACGNWRTLYPATDSRTYTGGLRNALDEFDGRIAYLVNNSNSEDTASERMIKNFYKSCMHEPEQPFSEIKREMKKLFKEFGKMPALEGNKWQNEHFDWLETVGKIWNKYGIAILFQFKTIPAKDNKSNTLLLEPQEQDLKDSSGPGIDKFKSLVERDLIHFLGIKQSTAKVTASKIAKLEASLVKAAEEGVKFGWTVDIAQNDFLHLDLLKLMNISFGYVPTGQIFIPTYVQEVADILKKTPKATVANYIFYHLMSPFAVIFLNRGESNDCVEQIISLFPLIVSKMSHRGYHLAQSIPKYNQLWQDIATSLNTVLESDRLRWYDDENREFALEKLHSMKLFVDSFEDYDFDEAYSSLAFNASDYMKTIKLIKAFNSRKFIAALDMQPDILANVLDYSTPLYANRLNAVVFPVSTLLSNFFMISFVPKALKYSRMGFLFGHEIMHGFSGEFRLFNRIGDYVGTVGDIQDEYSKRKNCILEQYQNYEYIKTSRPQQESQEENIADVAGIALAYQAYMRWLKDGARTQEELNMETLPNLNYTNKQLFFIYYSQTWCADYTAYYEESSVNYVHSLDPIRAVLPLENFEEFAKAFNCPVGSQMNPRKKCSLY